MLTHPHTVLLGSKIWALCQTCPLRMLKSALLISLDWLPKATWLLCKQTSSRLCKRPSCLSCLLLAVWLVICKTRIASLEQQSAAQRSQHQHQQQQQPQTNHNPPPPPAAMPPGQHTVPTFGGKEIFASTASSHDFRTVPAP
eukprot:1970618-Amphidinium_carterae.1